MEPSGVQLARFLQDLLPAEEPVHRGPYKGVLGDPLPYSPASRSSTRSARSSS